MKPKLIKTKYGFYQYRPLPSEKTLEKYYAQKYYQNPQATSYTATYHKEEIKYFKLKTSLIFRQVIKLHKLDRLKTMLDVGCGEGWLLNRFHEAGVCVQGVDLSCFAIQKFNPHLIKYFEQGNISKILDTYSAYGKKFNLITMANVIEHVINPVELLKKAEGLLAPHGLFVLVAPNDFSLLHQYLLKHKFITRRFWEAYPDHLNYFNKESMEHFLSGQGWKIHAVVADNPIDLNLLNDNSNYIKDRFKGKNTHIYRVRTDNFLAGISEEKLLEVYTTLGSLGVGRDLSYYATRKR
jgi:2-polyprenyl-3-methyl-5-hydroxy-6-metoxy-1,4-benzoquinol methylase